MAAPNYPWRENNSFELMMDGDCFFPRLLDAMERLEAGRGRSRELVETD